MEGMDPEAGWATGQLRSARFDDVYFSADGGLGEARAVFLQGCGLPEGWQGRRRFTVGELGFGTGLNILALLQAWQQHRPPGATLHIFSVEGFPLSRADAAAAHAHWPELSALSAPLLAQWPAGARGMHRMGWQGLGATLDLAVMDVDAALAGWTGKADAWFLDGFSPAKNPAMWSADVLAAVARASAPGARAATYSVAAAVRRGLEAGGFALARKPGFGHKRERLEASLPGEATDPPMPRIAIIGAGIAGASVARAFADQGVTATVYAAGAMASGNPAALVSPRLAAGSAVAAALHAQAFRRAVQRIGESAPDAIIARGVVQLLRGAGEAGRGDATIASGLFDPGSIRPADADGGSLLMEEALVVQPEALRAAWLADVQPTTVAALRRAGTGWALMAADGAVVAEADAVVLAAGFASAALASIPLRPVRGQVSFADVPLSGPPTSWGGYVIPTRTGMLFGATHGRGDADAAPRTQDEKRNIEGLRKVRPALAAALAGQPLGNAAGVRAAAGDYQPVAGRLDDGLYALTGLGGRGFTLAPLMAEHVAALVLGLPSPLTAPMAALVDPARLFPKAAARAPALS